MNAKFSLKNKTAIITGGGSGIGKAIATTFAQHGALVQILDSDINSATQEEILALGFLAQVHQCDVKNTTQVHEIIQKIGKDTTIDILINNAGTDHLVLWIGMIYLHFVNQWK